MKLKSSHINNNIVDKNKETFTKAFNIYILLAIVLCIAITTSISYRYIDQEVNNINNASLSQQTLMSGYLLENFIKNKHSSLETLSKLPFLINFVTNTAGSLVDSLTFFDSYQLDDNNSFFMIFDYEGNLAYSKNKKITLDSKNTDYLNQLLNEHTAFSLRLLTIHDKNYLGIYLPIKYNQLTEGVIVGIFSIDFTKLYRDILDGNIIELYTNEHKIFSNNNLFKNSVIKKLELDKYNLTLAYHHDITLREKNETLFKVNLFALLGGGIFIAFILIFIAGRKYIISPYNQISKYQKQLEKNIIDLNIFKEIISNANDIIIVTEVVNQQPNQSKIVYVNQAFTRVTGYSLQQVEGLNPRVLQGKATLNKTKSKIKKSLEEKNSFSGEILNYTSSGESYWIDLNIFPIYGPDKKLLYLAAVERDITERKMREKQLQDLLEDVSKSEAIAREASRSKSIFLSNMSHEIRTPLTAILGNAEIIQSYLVEKSLHEEQQMINRIIANSDHLLRIINDILDSSKIEAGKLNLEYRYFNLIESLATIEKMFIDIAADKSLSFIFEKSDTTPEFVCGDEVRIKQILINLLSNATKFTPEGGEIIFQTDYTGEDTLVFKITDTGIGIAKDKQKDLFQAFMQADESTTRKFGGTGLGLSICKQLCQLMDGDLCCESELEKGTTFTASIKASDNLCKLPNADKNKKLNSSFTSKNILAKSKRILVAEDSPDNQRIIEWHLQKLNVEYDIVENGEKAVSSVIQESYGLVLMDIQMPVMGGVEATKKIKELEIECPIVALTANTLKEQIDEYAAVGFDDYLSKPFSAENFKKLINKYINQPDTEKKQNAESQQLDDFEQIRVKFLKQLTNDIDLVKQIIIDGNASELARFTHSLKSSAGFFQYDELTKVAQEIESLLKNGNQQEAFNLASSLLRDQMRKVVANE